MDLISNFSMDLVNKAMDGLQQRQTAVASNLANVDTPGYRRQDVSFETQLQQAVSTHQQSFSGGPSPNPAFGSNDAPLNMLTNNPWHLASTPTFSSLDEITPIPVGDDGATSYRNDNNNVDVEMEMVALAKNSGKFNALANLEGRALHHLKSVIQQSGQG
jgi:flagellar basal-body rod protein FlgB